VILLHSIIVVIRWWTKLNFGLWNTLKIVSYQWTFLSENTYIHSVDHETTLTDIYWTSIDDLKPLRIIRQKLLTRTELRFKGYLEHTRLENRTKSLEKHFFREWDLKTRQNHFFIFPISCFYTMLLRTCTLTLSITIQFGIAVTTEKAELRRCLALSLSLSLSLSDLYHYDTLSYSPFFSPSEVVCVCVPERKRERAGSR